MVSFTRRPEAAMSHELTPRDWQVQALPMITERIRRDGAATLSAAPGAGKTIFAGLTFRQLRDLDEFERIVVVVPNRTLVDQWAGSLHSNCGINLKPFYPIERPSQDGVVVTYQSLTPETIEFHRDQAARKRTLLVLDEVHHVGDVTQAWATCVQQFAGTIDGDLHVAGILNLSGTLWRSNKNERISTVRYKELPDGRLESLVDWDVPVEQLIGLGQLRPIDLFRLGAEVRVGDWHELAVLESRIADLDARPARAVIAGLPKIEEWRDAFIRAVIDRLEQAYRSLDSKVPVKALIVASKQEDAVAFRETANRILQEDGLKPFAVVAVSDLPDAADTLDRFRRDKRVGVLCTVGMAGEGYDCPDIAVVGFASNKLTPLYVRQVVARAQRVTTHEATQGRPIPAAIVLPDAPLLVKLMSEILAPMHHEIATRPAGGSEDGFDDLDTGDGGDGTGRLPAFVLEGATVETDVTVRVTGVEDGDVEMDMVRLLEQALVEVSLRPSDAARVLVAVRHATTGLRDERPFQPLPSFERSVEELGNASRPSVGTEERPRPERVPMSTEHQARALERKLARLSAWWYRYGDQRTSVPLFTSKMNAAGGIAPGKRPSASVEQLQRSWNYGWSAVEAWCRDSQTPPPNPERWKT
jgi:superfamily II DNA or RNA helicase